MGLFSLFGNSDDVPDTIGEERMNEIRAAGQWANRNKSWFSEEAVDKRLADNEQREKRWWS
jgi:hypothetical protein